MTVQPRPHLVPIEALIFAGLLDNKLIPHLGMLALHHGVQPQHRTIVEHMLVLERQGKDVHFRSLQEALEATGNMELAGGVEYLCSLDLTMKQFHYVKQNWDACLRAAVKSSGSVN